MTGLGLENEMLDRVIAAWIVRVTSGLVPDAR